MTAGHAKARIERQISAMHREIARRVRAGDPMPVARARENLDRWQRDSFGGALPPAYEAWRAVLAQPVETVLEVLEGDDERARRLRASSPFAGVLGARERWAILRDAS
jgi:hypothetical protein